MCNQIHAFFRARVEHIFTRIWPFAMYQVWRGKGLEGACELQRCIHVLFHFINFELSRKIMYEPAGVWSHTLEGAPAAEEVEYETPHGRGHSCTQVCVLGTLRTSGNKYVTGYISRVQVYPTLRTLGNNALSGYSTSVHMCYRVHLAGTLVPGAENVG